jgi:hypothetical protein
MSNYKSNQGAEVAGETVDRQGHSYGADNIAPSDVALNLGEMLGVAGTNGHPSE